MTVRAALLALLSQGPRHGYQLKAEFDSATGEAWPLNYGQVYATLQRLERDGLVAVDDDPGNRLGEDGASEDGASEDGASEDGASEDGASEDGASEDGASEDRASEDRASEDRASEDGRVAYALTDAGRAELSAWVGSPVMQPLASRDEASLKVLLVLATGVYPVFDVISTQRAAAMANLQSLTVMKADAERTKELEAVAWSLHLDRMVMLAQAEVRWLDLTEERLRSNPPKTLAEAERQR